MSDAATEEVQKAPITQKVVEINGKRITLRKPSTEECWLIRLGHGETNGLMLSLACLAKCWFEVDGRPSLDGVDSYNVRQVGEAMLKGLVKQGYAMEDARKLANVGYILVYEVPVSDPAAVRSKANFSGGQGGESSSG